MTKIFKVNIESLEKRLEDAASVIAHNIVEQIKKQHTQTAQDTIRSIYISGVRY